MPCIMALSISATPGPNRRVMKLSTDSSRNSGGGALRNGSLSTEGTKSLTSGWRDDSSEGSDDDSEEDGEDSGEEDEEELD